MRLSLVVPTLNSLPLLKDLVSGITSATSAPDEIVFVDGFSTDGTLEFLSCAKFDCKVSILQRKPAGVYDAWNHGIQQAVGDWIMVACADDLIYPSMFARIRDTETYLEPRDGFLAWTIEIVDEQGLLLDTVPDPAPTEILGRAPKTSVCRLDATVEALLLYLLRGYRVSFMALAFRREVWEERPFRTDIGAPADIEWLMESHLRNWNTIQLPETLAAWRDRLGSITGGSSRTSRLEAHRRLQQQTIDRLSDKLSAASHVEKLKTTQPAIDVYDYIGAARTAPNLKVSLTMLCGALSAAGPLDFVRLALRRAGYLRRWKYLRPFEQARRIAGDEFFSNTIRSLSTALTSKDVHFAG